MGIGCQAWEQTYHNFYPLILLIVPNSYDLIFFLYHEYLLSWHELDKTSEKIKMFQINPVIIQYSSI